MALIPSLDPYPKSEIMGAITRSYEVKSFVWNATDARGTRVGTLIFPQDLFNVPYLQDKLKYYSLFRSGVKLTIRFNTTKFQFGELLVAWLPFYDEALSVDDLNRLSNIYKMSQCNPVTVSAQQGTSVEITLPWVHPHQWAFMDTPISEIGTVAINVLHPLSSAAPDPPASIMITVFANLDSPEIAGYSPDVAPATSVSRAQFLKTAKKTSRAEAITQSSRGNSVQKESEQKAEKGILTSIADGVATYAPLIGGIDPALAPIGALVSGVASALSPIFSALGLNKPTSTAVPTIVIPRIDDGLGYGKGLDSIQKLSLDPAYAISTTKGICGFDSPQPTLMEIITTPTLIDVGQFDTATHSPGDEIYTVPAAPWGAKVGTTLGKDEWLLSYAAYYGLFAQYWRGGLRFQIRFVTSSFVTCRVRISHLNEPLTSAISDVSGDLISKVVDICGDTTVDFFVPYINNIYYTQTQHPADVVPFEHTGVLAIHLVTPVVSNDTTAAPPVYFSVWQAASPDFRYMQLRGPIIDPVNFVPPTPDSKSIAAKKKSSLAIEAVTQCDIRKEFKKPVEGLIHAKYMPEAALINGEDFGTLNTMLHRYVSKTVTTGAGLTNYRGLPCFQDGFDTHFAMVAPFLFMRGSARMYFPPVGSLTGTAYPACAGPELSYTGLGADRGVAHSGTFVQPMRFELPWYDFRAFIETLPGIDASRYDFVTVSVSHGAGASIYYSLGDDFSVGILSNVPTTWITTPPIASASGEHRMHGRSWPRMRCKS